mmetsp:Transcript_63361/g.169223  ORF Transcript_63361/g.169223 Transcript_63361/m.169223 type:complete len:289 (+) Transcript_63361:66-932(+)
MEGASRTATVGLKTTLKLWGPGSAQGSGAASTGSLPRGLRTLPPPGPARETRGTQPSSPTKCTKPSKDSSIAWRSSPFTFVPSTLPSNDGRSYTVALSWTTSKSCAGSCERTAIRRSCAGAPNSMVSACARNLSSVSIEKVFSPTALSLPFRFLLPFALRAMQMSAAVRMSARTSFSRTAPMSLPIHSGLAPSRNSRSVGSPPFGPRRRTAGPSARSSASCGDTSSGRGAGLGADGERSGFLSGPAAAMESSSEQALLVPPALSSLEPSRDQSTRTAESLPARRSLTS